MVTIRILFENNNVRDKSQEKMREKQIEGLTSGLRLLTNRTQCPAEMLGNPSLVAPGRDREARAPGRAGTVRPG